MTLHSNRQSILPDPLEIQDPEQLILDALSPQGSGSESGVYLMWACAIAPTYVLVYASSFDDASEALCDWALDHCPGLFVEPDWSSARAECGCEQCLDPAADPCDEAWQDAEEELTLWGHEGLHYAPSDDWGGEGPLWGGMLRAALHRALDEAL